MTKKARALPRKSRQYPQTERCFSINFPLGIEQSGIKCFVPLEDYRTLEKKYVQLFKQYKRKSV